MKHNVEMQPSIIRVEASGFDITDILSTDKLPPAINIYGTIFQAIRKWKYNNRDFITFSSLVVRQPRHPGQVLTLPTLLEDGSLATPIPAYLIKPSKKTLRRNTIKTMIQSNEKYAAYRSRSELGVWRLLFFNDNGSFYKGKYDYVQQTMIHFDLQKYFNEHYDSLPVVDGEIEKLRFTTLGTKYIGIDDSLRRESIPIFHTYYWDNLSHQCGQSYPNRDQDLKHFSDELQTLLPTPGKPILVYKNYNFTDIEPGNSTIRMNADIYRIVLGRIGDKSIVLFFMLYNLSVIGENYRSINIRNKLGPLLLTTSLKATRYGVFQKFIPSGNYICKMLDYTQQCLATNLQCTRDYSFIGHLYENIWPYTHPTLQKLIEDKVSSNNGDKMLANAAERVASNVTAENLAKAQAVAVAEAALNGGKRKTRRKQHRRNISRKRRS